MTIARITVEDGPLTEHPLAEKVRGGWQNGVTFYPDEKVTSVAELMVSRRNDTSITQYLDDLPTHISHVPVSHIRNRLAAHDAQVLRDAAQRLSSALSDSGRQVTWLRLEADRIANTNQQNGAGAVGSGVQQDGTATDRSAVAAIEDTDSPSSPPRPTTQQDRSE